MAKYIPGGDVTQGINPPKKTLSSPPPTPKPQMQNKEKKMSILQRIMGAAKSQNKSNSWWSK